MQFIKRLLIGFVMGCGLCFVATLHAEAPARDAWRLVPIDGDGSAICAPGRAALLRTGMPISHCESEISAGPRGARVVRFTCGAEAWGRSVFRPLGGGTMRIETQGIRHGQPFAIDYEARAVPTCG